MSFCLLTLLLLSHPPPWGTNFSSLGFIPPVFPLQKLEDSSTFYLPFFLTKDSIPYILFHTLLFTMNTMT